MALKQYEGMFLLDSGKYAANPSDAVAEVLGLLEHIKAEVLAHRPWQDGKLAYPVGKHTKGVHYLVYFKADSLSLTEFERRCSLNATVLRKMIIVPPTQLFDLMVESLASVDTNTAATNDAAKSESESEEETTEKAEAVDSKEAATEEAEVKV